jgi:hypothetical protein
MGTLQQSTNVLGPYTSVAGAVSPRTNAPSASAAFYRLLLP